jgi:predicted O-methyltransferase YrrM
MSNFIEGQLSPGERQLLTDALLNLPVKPQIAIEVGTWLGGGSTLHILRALHQLDSGHLWGVEAYKPIYEKMVANLRAAVPEALDRFTPLFGFSDKVLPEWLAKIPANAEIDFAFLDGGDNPNEQIEEFYLLAPHMKVGGVLMAHDARMRKGKWIVPYVSLLDNWESEVFNLSKEGLFRARKLSSQPSGASRKAAERMLFKMRLQPAELVARFLPSKLCGLVLRTLPKSLVNRLWQGGG